MKVISDGGFLKKAVVKLIPLCPVEKEPEISAEEEDEAPEEEEISEEKPRENRKNYDRRRDGKREDRRPRERKEYFTEERAVGKAYLEEIAKYFTKNARIDTKATEDEICFYIGGEDSKKFIGHRGETLDAIQTLVSQVVNDNREEKEHVRVTVDADFYRERRKRILTALAKRVATEAYENKSEISLEPMNSYERRIVHGALQNSDYATTRSEGEGKDRHVVIVPKCEVISYGNVSSDFKKKGPKKTKSYGGKKVVY